MIRQSLLILCSAAAIAAAPLPAFADDALPGKLTVTGQGESTAAPDMAVLSLSVVREADTARDALSADNSAMAAVIDAIKKAGIAERDLQTGGLAIEPRYLYPNEKNGLKAPKIVGYAVTNTLTVRMRDLSKVGEVLDRSVTLGVNSGGGISFTNEHPEKVLEEARKNAVHDALDKAKTLTEAAGVGIGPILAIREDSNRPRPVPMAMEKRVMAAAADAVPVMGGENTYHVDVTMTFELKQ